MSSFIYKVWLSATVMIKALTLCILMDFPILIITIRMGLCIIHFKGSQVEISKKKYVFQSLTIVFILAKSAGPDEMLHFAAFHLGLHYLPKYPFRGFRYTKGQGLFMYISLSAAILNVQLLSMT